MADTVSAPPSDGGRTTSSLTNAATALVTQPPPHPHRPLALIAVATAAAAGVLILGIRFLGPHAAPVAMVPTGEGPKPPAAASGADARDPQEAARPAGVPAQEAVKLTVRVTPATARIFLDGALLSAGSFEGKVFKGDQARRIRVEAPHHVAKEETVQLAGDVILSFALEKETAPPPSPPAAWHGRPEAPPPQSAPPPPPPSPSPAPTPAPGPPPNGQKPKRAIDSDSPYAPR